MSAGAGSVGIIGVTPEAAANAYRDLMMKCYEVRGRYKNPSVLLYTQPLIEHVSAFGNIEKWGLLIQDAVDVLVAGGADVIWMPANSSHLVADRVDFRGREFVNMINVAEKHIASISGKVLMLGTSLSVSESLYLRNRGVVEKVVRPCSEEQDKVHDIIINELILGGVSGESRKYILDLIERYAAQEGVNSIFFACTELPYFFNARELPLPVQDSVRVSLEHLVNEYLLGAT